MLCTIKDPSWKKSTLRKGLISPEGYVIFFIIFIFMDSKTKHVCIEFNESKNRKKIFTTVCYGNCCLCIEVNGEKIRRNKINSFT